MIEIFPLQSPHFGRNRDTPCPANPDAYPCVVGGTPVPFPRYMVHLHDGGAQVVTEEEAATLDPRSDLGMYPLGANCLRKFPQLQPYVRKEV